MSHLFSDDIFTIQYLYIIHLSWHYSYTFTLFSRIIFTWFIYLFSKHSFIHFLYNVFHDSFIPHVIFSQLIYLHVIHILPVFFSPDSFIFTRIIYFTIFLFLNDSFIFILVSKWFLSSAIFLYTIHIFPCFFFI